MGNSEFQRGADSISVRNLSPDDLFQHVEITIESIRENNVGELQQLLSLVSLDRHVVLDFRNVKFINETGVGSIIRLRKVLQPGCKVFGIEARGQVLEKIQTAKIAGTVIHLRDTLECAKEAMKEPKT